MTRPVRRVVLLLFALVLVLGSVTLAVGAGGAVVAGWPKQDVQLHKQEAVDSVTDVLGNVYVTGIRNLAGNNDDDWWTIKFNSDGSVAWRTSYNSSGKSDKAIAITLDADMDVIVTGIATNGANTEIHTEKYNGSSGAVIWQRTLTGSGNDMASAIAVDNQKNVYVAGYTRNAQGKKHVLVLKYSHSDTPAQDGLLLWQRTHDADSANTEEARSIAADDNGVAITGFSGPGPGYDLLTVVYNNVGDQLWEKRYGPVSAANWGKQVKLAPDGKVVVTGFATNALGNKDIYTARYDRAAPGALIWEATYDSSYEDEPRALAVDGSGNVYVTGSTWTVSGNYDFYTVKYGKDPQSGTTAKKLWASENIFDSGSGNSDIPTGMTIDPTDGDVFIAGYSDNGGQTDFQTIKIKGDTGAELWRSTFDNALQHNDRPVGIGLSTEGDALVAGWSDMTDPFDGGATTASGGTQGTVEKLGRTWTTDQWAGFFVTMTSGDNIDTTRRISGNSDTVLMLASDFLLPVNEGDGYIISDRENYDYQLIKYQAGGVNRPTGLVAQAISATSIQLTWIDNSTNEDGFNVYRWDPVGKVWIKLGGGAMTIEGENAGAVASYTDSSGVAGDTRYEYRVTSVKNTPADESRPSNQAFAVTTIMTPVSPVLANIYTFDGGQNKLDVAASIAVGPDNKPVVTGNALQGVSYDYLTLKLNTDLSLIWKDVFNDDSNGTDEATVVAVDNANDVIVSGYAELDNGTTGNSSQIYTQKYSGSGSGTTTTTWHAQYTGTPRISDRAEAVATAVDGSNNVVVAGRGKNTNGNYDIYVIKYGPDKNPDGVGNNIPPAAWNPAAYDRGGDDQPVTVAFDSAGNVFVAGYSEQALNGTASGGSTTDIIIATPAWPVDKWKYSNVLIMDGLNEMQSRRITGNTVDTLTVDPPFTGGPITPGTTFIISNSDWFVAKYDGITGARIWTDIYDSGFGNDQAYGAAVDPVSGDLYVIGYRSNAAGNSDIYTIKYKGSPAAPPTAEKLWSDGGRSYDGAGHGDDYAVGVKVNPLTRRVVVGGSVLTGPGDHDYALFMYNPDGSPVWAPEVRIPLKPDSDDDAVALAVDNSENIYLTGTISRIGLQADSMTLKYSPEGVLMGTTVFNGPLDLEDESAGIAVNSRGEVFVAGSTQNATNTDVLVYKINADPLQVAYPLAANPGYRAVTLSWPDDSSGEDGYNLQRTTGSCTTVSDTTSWTNLGPLAKDTTTHTDKGLNISSSYCYRIQSFDGTAGNAGYRESLWAMASATTLNPEAPGSLTATIINTNRIDLSWPLPTATGQTGFVIERCTGAGCTFDNADPSKVSFPALRTDATSFSDTTVCADTTYRYRITTVNQGLSLGGAGGWSTRKELAFTDYRPDRYARITINHVAPMLADFSDIRFYDPVTLQELPFWIESKTDGSSAVVVVRTGASDKALLYYGNAAAQSAGAVAGLVGYWPFNEDVKFTGQTSDLSGNANTGDLTLIQNGNGIVSGDKFGNALKLDGVNDYVKVADSPSLDLTGSFTIETWYQYDKDSRQWSRIISKPGTGGSNPTILYGLLLDEVSGAQRPYLEFASTGSPRGPNLTHGEWYHLVGRYDAAKGRASIFVNGTEYGQNVTPVAIVPNAEPLGIGSWGIYGATTMGMLDEVKIYSRPLLDQEIIAHYGMYSSAITLGSAELPPVGSTFDFGPLAWQSVYVTAANAVTQPPAAPSLVSVSRISEVQLDLSWTDNSSDETGFLIERMCTAGPGCPTPETEYTTVANGTRPAYSGTGTKGFSDTSVKPNTTYSYRVRAVKSGACGWNDGALHDILSNVISKTASVNVPVITSTTVASTTTLNMAWTDDAASLTGYRVERCTGTWAACANGDFSVVGGSPTRSYDDIDACANTDYTYRVAAVFNGLSASGGPWAKQVQVVFEPGTFKPNFKTRLTLTYDAAMKQDFSDIRFFDTAANRELPYYIENKTDGVSATVRIRTGDSESILLYYGNRKAADASSLQGVFGAGLMAYWRFDEPADITSTTLGDLVGGVGNSPLIAPVTANYGIVANGVYGNALRLNGSMNATKDTVTLPTGSIASVEAWIKPEGYNDVYYNGIVTWGPHSTGAASFDMAIQNNGRPTLATWGNDAIADSGTAATLNQWNHIAAVMNGKDVTLYMNGTPVVKSLGTLPNVQSLKLSIGSTDYPLGRNFKGYIDELRVYNQVLSPQDIASSYATDFPRASVDFGTAAAASAVPGEWLGTYSLITAQSASKTTSPAKPTGLTVDWISEKELKLTWNDNTSDENGYVVERKCTAGTGCSDPDFAPVPASPIPKHVGTGSMNFNDTGLNPGWTYAYRVRPYKNTTCGNIWDNAGGVLNSNVASQITTVKEPSAPGVAHGFGTRCNDIRFTDAGGAPLPFWLREDCNTAATLLFVRKATVPVNSSNIYMYYGNSSAEQAFDGTATFDFFDDFSGSSIDTTTKWNLTGTGFTVSDGYLHGTNTNARLTSKVNFSSTSLPILQARAKTKAIAPHGQVIAGFYGSSGDNIGWLNYPGNMKYLLDGVETPKGDQAPLDMLLTHNISISNATNVSLAMYNFDARASYWAPAAVTKTLTTLPIALGQRYDNTYGNESYTTDWDWVYVRKNANPVPTLVSGGIEYNPFLVPYDVNGISLYGRRSITVSNTGAALNGYQLVVNADTTTLATDQITITWTDELASETGYTIKRCEAGAAGSANCDPSTQPGDYASIGRNSSATGTYTDENLPFDKRYCYSIKALVPEIVTSFSTTTLCADTSKPTAPTGLNRTINGIRVDLTWSDTTPGIPDSYILERCNDHDTTTCTFDSGDALSNFRTFVVPRTQKSYSDSDTCIGTTYRYRVKSVKPWVSAWPGGYTNTVDASLDLPAQPSNVRAIRFSETQMNLNWDDNTSDESGYRVLRCSGQDCIPSDPGPGSRLFPDLAADVKTFSDYKLTTNTHYTYQVVAFKNGTCGWNSPSTITVDAKNIVTTLIPPALTASTTIFNTNQINLSWTDSTTTESGYVLLSCSDASCSSSTPLATPGLGITSYADTNVCNPSTYYYQVKGFKDADLTLANGGKWTKRALINFTNFQPNYQTQLTITLASYPGIDATTLKDVRFYDATAGSELPYWIESIAAGVATVWIKTGDNFSNIYMYYANASASAVSNDPAVFPFRDNLETGTAKWIQGNVRQDIYNKNSGTYSGKLTTSGALISDTADISSMTRGKITLWYNMPGLSEIIAATLMNSDGNERTALQFTNRHVLSRKTDGAYEMVGATLYNNGNNTTWYKVEMEFDTIAGTFKPTFNGTTPGTKTLKTVAGPNDIRYFKVATVDAAGETIYFDDMVVTNYSSALPTAALGGAETNGSGYVFTSTWTGQNASNIVSATPPSITTPTLVSATRVSESRIDLAWTDTNNDEVGYYIDHCSDASCSTVIKTINYFMPASPAGSFSDTGLTPGATYYYRLRAYKPQPGVCGGNWISGNSDVKSDTTTTPVPTNLVASIEGSNLVHLAWTDTTQGDGGFSIERSEGGSPFAQIGTVGPKQDPYLVRYTFNNTLTDSSGSGLHLSGTPPVYEDGGLRLSTATSYQSPVTSILDTDTYTIEFDFKMKGVTPNAGSWYQVFASRPPGYDRSPGIWQENSSRAMFTWQHNPAGYPNTLDYSGISGVGPSGMDGSQFSMNTWYHIKGVKNGSNFKIYVNGGTTPVAEVTNVANPKPPGASPLYFGGAEIVLKNFTISQDAESRKLYTDNTPCGGHTYTYQVRAINRGLALDGGGCWKQRTPLTFSNFQPNFQTRVVINSANYPAVTDTVTYEGMQSDFRDIRFYNANSDQELPYWIEKISGTTAIVWVKTGTSKDNIYLYYGNPSALSASNGENVFEFFDGFDDARIDTNKWTILDGTGFSVTGGYLRGTNSTGKLAAISTFGTNLLFETKARTSQSAVSGQNVIGFEYSNASSEKKCIGWLGQGGVGKEYTAYCSSLDGTSASSGVVPVSDYMIYRMKFPNSTKMDVEMVNFEAGTLFFSNTGVTIDDQASPMKLSLGRRPNKWNNVPALNEPYVTDWDWFRARKYMAAEPSVTLGTGAGIERSSCFAFGNAWQDVNLLSNTQTVTLPVLAPPSGLTVAAGSDKQAALTWVDNSADETGFKIERCTSAGSTPCDFTSLDAGFPFPVVTNSTMYSNSGLSAETGYCYRVRSYRDEACAPGQAESEYSSTACITTSAAAPYNLQAVAQNQFKVLLTWEYAASANEEGFEVQRQLPGGGWSLIGTTAANVMTYSDTAGIEPGKKYVYRVRAFYGKSGTLVPGDWTQRGFIRNITGGIVTGEDITAELSAGSVINIVDAANGTARVTPSNGMVELFTTSTGGGISTAVSSSRTTLKNLAPYAGDFDVQVDYTLPDGQLSSGQWVVYARLHIAFGQYSNVSLYRAINNGSNQYYGQIVADGTSSFVVLPTSDTFGKLRIKRMGNVMTISAWSGGKWISVHQGSCSTVPATAVQLLQEVRRLDTAAVRVLYSNFAAAGYDSPYSNPATVSYTSGTTTIYTTPGYVLGASPCN